MSGRPTFRPRRIVSGGQTGADQGALEAAEDLGIDRGGYIPKGFLTELGSDARLAARFGLTEHASSRYPPRTEQNVIDADATLVVATALDGGTGLTVRLAQRHRKPYLHVTFGAASAAAAVRDWLLATRPMTLNVAGNRESRAPGIQAWVRALLCEVLTDRDDERSMK